MRFLPLGIVDTQLTSSVRLWFSVKVIYTTHLSESSLRVGVISMHGKVATIMASNHLHFKDLNVEVFDA
jgi:hypothetical protein